MSKDIFSERINIKPYEYPEIIKFADAINNSYWLVSEFNFTTDIQDFKTKLSKSEQKSMERTMLAIAQIEISVKTFWADIYKRLPKSEIAVVGMTFAESEVRHQRAYSHLLEVLGLNSKFEDLIKVPQIERRIKYLKKYLNTTKSKDNRLYTKSIMLFSMFVEHVSLFSQFLIMKSFNRHKNILSNISNVVEATSKEEELHGLFGASIIDIIRNENLEWFDEDMDREVKLACQKAMEAEIGILDWIFEDGELDFLPKIQIIEFLKNRFNTVLENGKFPPLFKVDEKLIEPTEWFELELKTTKEDDFFYKNSVNYNKRSRPITKEDLF